MTHAQRRQPGKAIRPAPLEGDVVGCAGSCAPNRRPLADDEGPSDDDLERFGGVTRTCPECGRDIFDDAQVCYHCGHAVEDTERTGARTPAWVLAGALAAIGAMIVFFIRR